MSDKYEKQYTIEKRINSFHDDLGMSDISLVVLRARFHNLVIDIKKEVIQQVIAHPITNMRTIDELKTEIHELENLVTGVTSEIEVMNAKNQNAQKRREMIKSKIDGLRWVLDESDEQESAG